MEKISPVYHQSAVQLREPARRLAVYNVTKSVRACAQVDHESHVVDALRKNMFKSRGAIVWNILSQTCLWKIRRV